MSPEKTADSGVIREYFEQLRQLLASVDLRQLERVVQILREARDRGASVYVIGNGGSAATASHFATDLSKATKRSGVLPLRVMGLTDNVPLISALANDDGYDSIFTSQLEPLLRAGDVLIAISVSGNSLNVVRAVEFARQRDATTIALLGFDGGRLLTIADFPIHVASVPAVYGPVEDTHLALHHLITACLANS